MTYARSSPSSHIEKPSTEGSGKYIACVMTWSVRLFPICLFFQEDFAVSGLRYQLLSRGGVFIYAERLEGSDVQKGAEEPHWYVGKVGCLILTLKRSSC